MEYVCVIPKNICVGTYSSGANALKLYFIIKTYCPAFKFYVLIRKPCILCLDIHNCVQVNIIYLEDQKCRAWLR